MNKMFQKVEADLAVSVTDLKKNPTAVVKAAETEAVAILNHNRVVAYVVSPAVWEYVQELHDDAMIVEELETMDREEPIRVNIDEI
jgi:antitoxin StbD